MDDQPNMVTLQETLQELPQEQKGAAVDQHSGHVPPVFVVGVWRSGTTLLYSLLNQHPDLRLFFESDLPVLWPMFRFPWTGKGWLEKWEYWNASLSRHDLDPERLEGPVRSLAEAMEKAGREYAAQKGKKHWGCKSPSYYDRLDFLAREFPDARFVIIWRDPEEVGLSVIKAKATALWFTRPGMNRKALLAPQILKTQVDKIISMGALVHQLHFRDLIEKTDPTMRAICEFLQLPFDPAMTELSKADRTAVFEGGHHKLAMGDKIVSKKERKEALPPALAQKIARYKARWRTKEGDRWMLSARFAKTDSKQPTLVERCKDQVLLIALRAWDIVPRICFSILPLSAWQTYRKLKYKDADWVHRQITTKESKFPAKANTKKNSKQSQAACAVRFGKIILQSMPTDDLLSTDNDQLKHIVTVNAEIFTYAHQDPALGAVLQHSVNTIDGRVIHQMCSLLYPGRGLRKQSGSDFIYNLADHAAKRGESVFLLGADPEANQGALAVLRSRYPALKIDGFSPEFSPNIGDQKWNENILSRVSEFHPVHLVVCFGPVKQEMWIAQNANLLFRLGVRCAYGLGGTLDFVSGRKKRAPKWTQTVGVEWLYRALTEPGRLARTAKMFKMPYFALRYFSREVELTGIPGQSARLSEQ
ncbi:MAG: WecB/TagA/CpsF family glycosyltransferase [Candidatus Sulfotelmatobacter sp.]